jgi:hypothetical protein
MITFIMIALAGATIYVSEMPVNAQDKINNLSNCDEVIGVMDQVDSFNEISKNMYADKFQEKCLDLKN